ncbi:MAG: DsbE family thiol:disulfide interchange protein [Gammaproteobacteria bacterium]|nr:DsbE family thiol:disulfide interchange protein [Gammaproteobacteria bacterium]MBJ54789.1 DsbE family thiol:disulfide interchange protein [Gammaproteobacteria bacterium]HBN15963.1 DsbE family thiol:disulfide interchange protein [Pseudohongiella sp.]|tara:strand:+ start:363 stop:914 length:552 start_codon:yes stop_codon:yes gene_type:complete
MKNLKLFLPVIVFAVLAVFMWRGLYLDSRTLPSMLIDRELPDFELRTLELGDQLATVEDLPDEPFILNIWGSYCLPCLQENPIFMAAREQDLVPIIGVNYKDTDNAAREWLDINGNPFTLNIVDDTGRYGIDLGVYGAPETFIVDANGFIRYKHIGTIDYRAWQDEIMPVVRQLQSENQVAGS